MFTPMVIVAIPSGKASSGIRLELDDDVCELHVALFFQMSQHTGSEEDLTLTNTVQVRVQLQSLDLQ